MTTYIAKRAMAAAALLFGSIVVIVSMASVLAKLNAVNAAASSLDAVLGTISATAVVGTLLVVTGVVCLGLTAYRWITISRL